jgi:hypothetical protein
MEMSEAEGTRAKPKSAGSWQQSRMRRVSDGEWRDRNWSDLDCQCFAKRRDLEVWIITHKTDNALSDGWQFCQAQQRATASATFSGASLHQFITFVSFDLCTSNHATQPLPSPVFAIVLHHLIYRHLHLLQHQYERPDYTFEEGSP